MGGGLGRGDDPGARACCPPPVSPSLVFPVNGLIHERSPLSRQSELWESFKEESFREDL